MIRLADILVSALVLFLVLPILVAVAAAIKLSSKGPVLYLAERVGKDGKPFRMYKFRTMHLGSGGPNITATHDSRVFTVGRIIRTLKLDELPQFVNVVRGDMAVVGPRPEAPAIVAEHYEPWMRETLAVRPGITSPGAIYYYAYGDKLLDSDDPERAYVSRLLAPKLALDLAYMKRETLWSNFFVVAHTIVAIIAKAIGKPVGPLSRDVEASMAWVSAVDSSGGEPAVEPTLPEKHRL